MKNDHGAVGIFVILFWIVFAIIVVAYIVLGIIALVKYGGQPITEVPWWVVWLFRR